MTDELAVIDIEHNGRVYRLRAFATMIMVERQPDGHNIPFPREGIVEKVYDDVTQTWGYENISTLIDTYEADPDGTNESRPN